MGKLSLDPELLQGELVDLSPGEAKKKLKNMLLVHYGEQVPVILSSAVDSASTTKDYLDILDRFMKLVDMDNQPVTEVERGAKIAVDVMKEAFSGLAKMAGMDVNEEDIKVATPVALPKTTKEPLRKPSKGADEWQEILD